MLRAMIWIAVAALLLAAGAAWWLTRPSRELVAESRAIAALLASAPPAAADRSEAALHEFYAHRGHRPAWSDGRLPNDQAFDLVHLLEQAGQEGLVPATYAAPALSPALDRLRSSWLARMVAVPESLAALDLALTRAFLRYTSDVHVGRLPDSTLDADWLAARQPLDPVQTLRRALDARRVAPTLEGLAPQGDDYRRLRSALARYREIAAHGGWPSLTDTTVLRGGDRGASVLALRRRLGLEGEADTTDRSPEFDASLAGALRAFQGRHGLPETGNLDAATRAALDVPAAARVRQIELNLERRRWLPAAFEEPCIVVSLADFALEVRDSGRTVLRSRVVVGEPRNPTPMFSDAVSYIVLNPTWRVPKRIVVEEILPALARDTSYLAKHQMRVFFTQAPQLTEVPHDSVDWSTVETDSFPYLVRQDGGPENPLGRIKFMCPNEYDVYLHDTPQKSYFDELLRAYSHGCVRVDRAHELAGWLLRRDSLVDARTPQDRATPRQPDARDSLDDVIASLNTRSIGLRQHVPVHFLYWTAWVDSAGAVQFREDLYGIDRRLEETLRSGRVGQFVLNPALEWGALHRRDSTAVAAARARIAAAATARIAASPRRR